MTPCELQEQCRMEVDTFTDPDVLGSVLEHVWRAWLWQEGEEQTLKYLRRSCDRSFAQIPRAFGGRRREISTFNGEVSSDTLLQVTMTGRAEDILRDHSACGAKEDFSAIPYQERHANEVIEDPVITDQVVRISGLRSVHGPPKHHMNSWSDCYPFGAGHESQCWRISRLMPLLHIAVSYVLRITTNCKLTHEYGGRYISDVQMWMKHLGRTYRPRKLPIIDQRMIGTSEHTQTSRSRLFGERTI
ncbi:hypothetical protein K474DRAFT_1488753 [Panus rudis PR-1116 ss-1]|nr:hypothetical protein K474DRAFT_1488753 [Panus rudis PR-1116 ss-1]